MEIKVYRKKQFASSLVPFGIVIGYEKDKFVELIKNRNIDINNCTNSDEREQLFEKYNTIIGQIPIFQIKNGETITLTAPDRNTNVFAINFNFDDTKIYPFAISNELIIKENTNIQLKQSAWLSTVKLYISKIK